MSTDTTPSSTLADRLMGRLTQVCMHEKLLDIPNVAGRLEECVSKGTTLHEALKGELPSGHNTFTALNVDPEPLKSDANLSNDAAPAVDATNDLAKPSPIMGA
ncbi:MAG: hypothetical protein DHS20C02_16510 [Micavibrio sp.]|nr:MAG: hypothetical protein DHS20C02_16510 [Micavibrio sp.]